ncbi:MAG: hypothetical protein JSS49_04295 [Planctomycetes bacterium]|nr:hypothetical protein [Planctomycetota bacterium]
MQYCEPRSQLTIPAIVCCLFLAACSSGQKPIELRAVKGTLKLQGEPVPNIILHFAPASGRPSTGLTDSNGAFELRYEKDRRGAVPGVHKVWIEYRPSSPGEEIALREGKSPLSTGVQNMLQKYGKVETTTCQVNIDQDQKNLEVNLE